MTGFFDNAKGGGGAPTANLKAIGDFVHGEVVDFYEKDYVPFGKTDPEKNKDGSTRQQLVVIVQTENRNWAGVSKVPTNDDGSMKDPSTDDGKRAIYVPDRSNIQFAIGRALSAAKADFEKGGKLGVKIANLEDTGKGNPLKIHEAVYTAPVAGAQFFGGTQQQAPAQAAPQTPSNPAYEAPAAPAQPAAAPAPAQAAPPAQDPWAAQPAAPAPSTPAAVDPWGGNAAPATPAPF